MAAGPAGEYLISGIRCGYRPMRVTTQGYLDVNRTAPIDSIDTTRLNLKLLPPPHPTQPILPPVPH
jgi:hypothetical protein